MSAEPNNVINAFSNINNSSNNNNGNEVKLKPVYGKILLTLENCILPPEKFVETPSSVDGLSKQHEYELRVLGTELIQTSGILLKLPQVAMATAQVLFHRFYYSKSFVRYPMEITAMSCITCASKIEEAPRRIRDVINVFHYMKQIRSKKDPIPLILDQNYINLKNQVIKAERRLLKELGFCVHVKHPHKFIVTLLQVLESEKNQRLMQTAWNYMNDSLRTDVFLRFTPETIACSCIYLSARVLRIPLPSKPAWFEIFGVNELDIREVCRIILKLYTAPPPNQEVLENVVNDLRKEYELQRQKLRAPTGNGVVTDKPVVESTASPVNKIKCSPKEFQKVQQINSQEHSNNATPPVSNHRAKRSRSRTRSATPEKYKSLKYSRTRTPTRSRSRTRTQSRSRSRSITPVKRHYNSHRNRSRTRSRSISPIRYRDHHHSSSNKRKRRSKTPTKHHKHHRHHHRYYETSSSTSRKSARPQSRDRYITSKRRSRSPRR